MTILFADVSGSTSLGEQLDPESMRALMGRYFAEMRTIIERHGGTVEKFIGDAVMAVFGIPQLHEDDALRAVRAAAEIRERLRRLNVELAAERGHRHPLPDRRQHRGGGGRRPGRRPDADHRRRGQHRRTAGAGRRAGEILHRADHLSAGARRGISRAAWRRWR